MNYYLINIETSDYIKLADKMTIGRKDVCTVVIKDDLVSGKHCRFHIRDRAIFIEDLNASNPVQVNNVEMNSKTRMKINNKDKLKIGSGQYYLSNDLPNQDLSYKSLVLEKVKIHETFDSDVDYEQHRQYWHEAASKKRSEVIKIEKRLKKVTSKKGKVDELSRDLNEVVSSLDTLEEKMSNVKNYSNEEIEEKIEYFTERINFFTQKKDEILSIKKLKTEYDELVSQKDTLKSKVAELAGDSLEKEHEELSKLYKTEIHALSLIDEKLKEKP
ncbi:FHA domain-containing protein [Halobacteriovorax sp.]|uniref:FHA domain-containing protein n=1 Tax=Halobacteriovorax sp. TaxID=2020862 RepID=UPI003564C291